MAFCSFFGEVICGLHPERADVVWRVLSPFSDILSSFCCNEQGGIARNRDAILGWQLIVFGDGWATYSFRMASSFSSFPLHFVAMVD